VMRANGVPSFAKLNYDAPNDNVSALLVLQVSKREFVGYVMSKNDKSSSSAAILTGSAISHSSYPKIPFSNNECLGDMGDESHA